MAPNVAPQSHSPTPSPFYFRTRGSGHHQLLIFLRTKSYELPRARGRLEAYGSTQSSPKAKPKLDGTNEVTTSGSNKNLFQSAPFIETVVYKTQPKRNCGGVQQTPIQRP
ncbi:sensory box protein [Anopheles sinensis]|uniref:Sensory box protein n=1 Tax=Anopheles sinensis TaxID=74873 RepID=A0A084W3F8_ANOSI|nr:sensory box protein [Anopheles sinensis]